MYTEYVLIHVYARLRITSFTRHKTGTVYAGIFARTRVLYRPAVGTHPFAQLRTTVNV
jgi:hypothetical protein